MTGFFLSLVDRSIAAGFVVLAVIAARALTRRSPKWTRGLLWALVAIRLLLPFTLHSSVSLVPDLPQLSAAEDKGVQPNKNTAATGGTSPIIYMPPQTGTTVTEQNKTNVPHQIATVPPVPDKVYTADNAAQNESAPTDGHSLSATDIAAIVWLVGTAILLLHGAGSYIRLRMRIMCATRSADGIWQSERISSAFVLGVLKPRIYLPYNVDEKSAEHIIAHERAHIRRADHITKLLAFVLLAVHWFNPMIWLAYFLFCRDIELACDERAVRAIEPCRIQEYTRALLACSLNHRALAVYPISFGETSIKARIKNILNYKKPTFRTIAVAVLVCIVTAVCFMTASPVGNATGDVPVQAPTDEQPSDKQPSDKQPSDEQPSDEQPATEHPTETPTEPAPDHTGEALFTYDAAPVSSVEISWQQDTEQTARLRIANGQTEDFARFANSLHYCAPADGQSFPAGMTVTLTYENEHTETCDLSTATLDGEEYAVCAQEQTEFFTILRDELNVYLSADESDGTPSAYTFILFELDPADEVEWNEDSINVNREGMWERRIDMTMCNVFSLTCGETEFLLINSGTLYDLQTNIYSDDDYKWTKPAVYGFEPEPEDRVWHPAGSTRFNIQPRTELPEGGTKVEHTPGEIQFPYWTEHGYKFIDVPIYEGEPLDSERHVFICIAETYEELLTIEDYLLNGNSYERPTNYTEEFFEDHSLIITCNSSHSGSIAVKPTELIRNGSELCITAETFVRRSFYSISYTSNISFHFSAMEIDKSALYGVDTISCYVRASNPPFPFKLKRVGLSEGEPVEFTVGYNDKNAVSHKDLFEVYTELIFAPREDKKYPPGESIDPHISFTAEDFGEVLVQAYNASPDTYDRLLSEYDDDFFAEHAVIILKWNAYEMLGWSIDGICRSDTELCVQVSMDYLEDGSYRPRMDKYLAVLEVDKSAFDGITEFSCYAKMRKSYKQPLEPDDASIW